MLTKLIHCIASLKALQGGTGRREEVRMERRKREQGRIGDRMERKRKEQMRVEEMVERRGERLERGGEDWGGG